MGITDSKVILFRRGTIIFDLVRKIDDSGGG